MPRMIEPGQLKVQTLELLNQLDRFDWFTNVGGLLPSSVARAATWREAGAICKTKASSNVALAASNLLTERLYYDHPKRYHRVWNSLVLAINPIWRPLCEARMRPIQIANKLSEEFVHAVDWDIVGACMEIEYADLIPPRYFKDRLDWYLAGHFPCGWEGDFPEGRLIVF